VLHGCILEVHCPSLPPVDGATISYTDGNFAPSVATYSCDAYGKPPQDGNASRTCQADGSWSGVAPTRCCDMVVNGDCLVGVESWDSGGTTTDTGRPFTLFLMPGVSGLSQDQASMIRYGNICASAGLSTFVAENVASSAVACTQFTCVKVPAAFEYTSCCDSGGNAIRDHGPTQWDMPFVWGADGNAQLHAAGSSFDDVTGSGRRVVCALEQ
jgi:hypothetical protein